MFLFLFRAPFHKEITILSKYDRGHTVLIILNIHFVLLQYHNRINRYTYDTQSYICCYWSTFRTRRFFNNVYNVYICKGWFIKHSVKFKNLRSNYNLIRYNSIYISRFPIFRTLPIILWSSHCSLPNILPNLYKVSQLYSHGYPKTKDSKVASKAVKSLQCTTTGHV